MAVEHIRSALNFTTGKSSLKLLLLCVANMASAVDNCFYPSIKYLEEKTELNKKTIIAGLRHFESIGVIKDTGRRTGATRQIVVYEYLLDSANKMHHYVYRLENEATGEFYVGVRSSYKRPEDDDYMGSGNWCRDCEYKGIKLLKTIVERFDSRAEAEMFEQNLIDSSLESDLCRNSAKTGTLYKEYQKRTERVPILDSKSTKNGQKEAQKRYTETKAETKANETVAIPPISPVAKLEETVVERIFEHWKKTMKSPWSKMSDKRRALIRKWLKTYSPDDLMMAITGCSLTAHNMGDNDRGQRYNSIELILRDAEHIERFIANSINPPRKKSSGFADYFANRGIAYEQDITPDPVFLGREAVCQHVDDLREPHGINVERD